MEKRDADDFTDNRKRDTFTAMTTNRITTNPDLCGGRPCIRGLRVRVHDVLEMLANGASRAEILEDFPYLEDEDITASLLYAAQQTDHPVLKAA